ncbi:MAG: aldo/keto reductase [Spirochaetes bacterium]|nr:MAG: aldo/keto reductase [Spirochaetota bacterium]
MIETNLTITRRKFLAGAAAFAAGYSLARGGLGAEERTHARRAIPSSGEKIPVIGMGTSRTFDAGTNRAALDELAGVVRAFFDGGGTVIDSSPMYGTSEAVVGKLLEETGTKKSVFAATKVWIDGRDAGIGQMRRSMELIGVSVMDLMQIHNLRDWQAHLPVLRDWKRQGTIRYIGITTSHGRSHDELEKIMRSEQLDFVQFSYSIEERAAEERLLPLAADRGIAVLINRPFQRGDMFRKVKGTPLPGWSAEFDCASWGQFFLKFVVSHPAVTCAIPASSSARHMGDNMGAGFGRMPDAAMRARMLKFYEAL